jgi:hypothetical protein
VHAGLLGDAAADLRQHLRDHRAASVAISRLTRYLTAPAEELHMPKL